MKTKVNQELIDYIDRLAEDNKVRAKALIEQMGPLYLCHPSNKVKRAKKRKR